MNGAVYLLYILKNVEGSTKDREGSVGSWIESLNNEEW